MSTPTKAGTGAGVILVISSTPATSASPAPVPASTPTALTVAPASSPTGIAVLQIIEHNIPELTLGFDDLTNTSSPSNVAGTVTKETVATSLEPGMYTATAVFLPSDAGLAAIQTAFLSGLPNQFQIQFPAFAAWGFTTSGPVYDFNAYVASLPVPTGSVTADKKVQVKISLKLTTWMTVKPGA